MAVKKKGKLAGTQRAAARRDLNMLYSANQIWAAGLGAMARAQASGSKIFEDLVREGSRVQGSALDTAQKVVMQAVQGAQKSVHRKVEDVRGQATETWDNLEKIFQTRVQRALHQLGMPTAEEINELTRKVEELSGHVEKLAQAGKAAPRRTARKRTGGRRKSAPKPGGSTAQG